MASRVITASNLTKMQVFLRRFVAVFMLSVFLWSCGSDPLDVDVSGIEVDFTYRRFDQEFVALDFRAPDASQILYQSYGTFAKDFTHQLLSFEAPQDREHFELCENFIRDPYMGKVYAAIQEVHNSRIEAYNTDLESAFTHLKFHFPEVQVPEVIYFHSGFFADTYVAPGQLAIGLDYYLGPEHPIVQSLPSEVAHYQRSKMRPDQLVVGAMGDFFADYFEGVERGERLVDHLVHQGKFMYILDAAMPHTPDSIKMRYTSSEMEWAQENETLVWMELADQSVMFDDSQVNVGKWINDGPWTNAGQIPDSSPSRLGIYIGWQMVRDYMEEHPEKTPRDLMNMSDAQVILSAYSPRD